MELFGLLADVLEWKVYRGVMRLIKAEQYLEINTYFIIQAKFECAFSCTSYVSMSALLSSLF